jgi:hypothetical protein
MKGKLSIVIKNFHSTLQKKNPTLPLRNKILALSSRISKF